MCRGGGGYGGTDKPTHVNTIMIHVNVNKSHVDIILVHVDIINYVHRRNKYAIIHCNNTGNLIKLDEQLIHNNVLFIWNDAHS